MVSQIPNAMTILVIGGGKMGMSHLALLTHYIGKSNVALCDTKFSTRLLFRFLGYKTFSSIGKLSKIDRLDGVIISTPTPSHGSLAHWAISQRVPFFVEKPLSLDENVSKSICDLACSAGVSAQVGFVLRYVSSFQRLHKLVVDGSLGKLKSYSASMMGNVVFKKLPLNSWQGDFSRGGGCLNEYGPHLIDLCRFIFGPVSQISKVKAYKIYSSNADDCIEIDWLHQNGMPASIEINWSDSTRRKSVIEFVVKFEYADLRVDNSTIEFKWHNGAPLLEEERNTLELTTRPKNVGFYLRGEEFSLELEDFLGICFRRNFHIDPSSTQSIVPRLQDGYEVDKLITRIASQAGLK